MVSEVERERERKHENDEITAHERKTCVHVFVRVSE